jgi:type IV pilus assembly protein PilE
VSRATRVGGARRGFTLIELVVAMLIVAILAAYAIPAYTSYIDRAKRTEAKSALVQAAQRLERDYTQAGSYSANTAIGAALAQAPPSGAANYTVTVTALTAQSFTLSATPCGDAGAACPAGASAFKDPQCDILTLDNTGVQGLAGAAVLTADECWRR